MTGFEILNRSDFGAHLAFLMALVIDLEAIDWMIPEEPGWVRLLVGAALIVPWVISEGQASPFEEMSWTQRFWRARSIDLGAVGIAVMYGPAAAKLFNFSEATHAEKVPLNFDGFNSPGVGIVGGLVFTAINLYWLWRHRVDD
jgi:hypothetical protein